MVALPSAVLFACTHNAVRSPMAEGILKQSHAQRIFVDSVGVRPGLLDPFAVEVMKEIGINISRHHPKAFDDLEDQSFDVVISLSPQAQHSAVEMTRTMACETILWNTFDPTIVEGSREVRLDAYRQVRDQLLSQIRKQFAVRAMGGL